MKNYAIARGLDPTFFEPHPPPGENEPSSCEAHVRLPEEEVPERYRHVADVKEYYTKRACAGESVGLHRFGKELEAMGFGAWPELSSLFAPFYHLPDDLPAPVHSSQPSGDQHSQGVTGERSSCEGATSETDKAAGSGSIVAEATVLQPAAAAQNTNTQHSSQNHPKVQI